MLVCPFKFVNSCFCSLFFRGEFVIILDGNHDEQAEESKVIMDLSIEDQVRELIENRNLKPNQAIKEVAKENRLKKQEVYNLYHHLD